ncbi:MAG: hypothetical protein ACRDKE_12550 [Solirubrobacterales bacterium]
MLAALLLVAVVAGVATADKARDRKVKSAANGTARASALGLANRIRALQATEGRLESSLAKASAKSSAKMPKTLTQKLTLASAADGNYLFAGTTEAIAELKNGHYEVTEIRSRVTRTDRVAGGTTVIFDRKNTYVLAIAARGGSVAFEDAKFKLAKRVTSVDATIYLGAQTDAKLAPIDSGKVKIGQYIEPICGDVPLLATLSDKGEAVIGRAKADCTDGEFDFTADLSLRRADGSRASLGPLSLDSGSSNIVMTGDRLLQASPFDRAAAIRTVSTDKLVNLWHPGTQTADIGPDGTVAMLGKSTEPQFTYEFDGYEYSGEVRAVPAARAPIGSFPNPRIKRNPKFRMPFVIFPQGDAENPVLVSASRARLSALKFCGANLYALESKSKSAEERYEIEIVPGLGGFASTERAPFEVQILDAQGALVRSLGKTKPVLVVGVGCNGDRLVIIAQQGTGVRAVEMGP